MNKLGLAPIFQQLVNKNTLYLRFDSITGITRSAAIKNNIVPVIIDFWLDDKDIPSFIKAYKGIRLLLVINREVYIKLREFGCPFPVEHWPLSILDQYSINEESRFKKDIDFCIFGRTNPFFVELLDKYCETHPEFVYVSSKGFSSNRSYYTNKGESLPFDSSRDFYIDLIKRTKISCYSTPGIDESKKNLQYIIKLPLACLKCYVTDAK